MGNAACHDYMWAYLFRYPGLVVLHDAQLHQARALWLTKRWQPRRGDYLAEFRANHPNAPPDVGELIAAGLGGMLYHHWPLIRLVVERARLTVVHNRRLLEDLRQRYPAARFAHVEMGVSDPLEATAPGGPHDSPNSAARAAVLQRHNIPPEATIVAAFGGITAEKRIEAIIRAMSALAERHPRLHLLLVGSAADHYDVLHDVRRWGLSDRVHLTGYVPDATLGAYLQAADVCACLRWPTNRETSASWLRCLAAGRTTIITDLAHLGDVPALDPRGWQLLATAADRDQPAPVTVSIDLLDEQHSLELALDRLATDTMLRASIGAAARAWWRQHHQLDTMVAAYARVMATALELTPPTIALPSHLLADGSERTRTLASDLGVTERLDDLLGTNAGG